MKSILSVGIAAVVAALSVYFFTEMKNPTTSPAESIVIEDGAQDRGTPTFSWSYQTIEDGEFPETEVSLTATYEDGSTETKFIEKAQGSCNEYQDPDEVIYQDSTMSICYYAGYGHYYKVIEEGGGYAIQRRIFEEASPDYEPPVLPFETIVQF